jgi:hypothetical protein
MPAQAVAVHRMIADNRIAVMAAHDPRTSWSAVQGPPDRVYAWCADIERAVRLRLSFLDRLNSVMIHVVSVLTRPR